MSPYRLQVTHLSAAHKRARRPVAVGQSLVEFALISTILLSLLLGMVDFGMVFYSKIVIKNAIAEGGYWAFQHPHDDITIRNVIVAEAKRQGIRLISDDIQISCAGTSGEEQTTITLSYDHPLLFTFVIPSSKVRLGDSIEMPQLGGC